MPNYTEQKSVYLTEEQWEKMKQAVAAGRYKNDSHYLRSMIETGESNIAQLDPRTSDSGSQTQATDDSPEEAAKSLSATILIEQLEEGKANKAGIEDVVSKPTQQFEGALAARLEELADDPTSPVTSEREGYRKMFWLEVK